MFQAHLFSNSIYKRKGEIFWQQIIFHAARLDNVSESTEHVSESSQYVSELDVSETTDIHLYLVY